MIRVCGNGYSSAMRPSGRTYFKTMRLIRYLCVIDAGRTCRLFPAYVHKIELNQPNTLLQPQYLLQSTSICVYFVEKCSKNKLDNKSYMAEVVNCRFEQSKRKGYTAQIVFTVVSDDVLW